LSEQDSPTWFKRTPNWVWYALIPIFGGLAITYAGLKVRTKEWIGVGLGFVAVSIAVNVFVPDWSSIFAMVWLGQFIAAYSLKQEFLIKTYPKDLPIPTDMILAKKIATSRDKVEINNCNTHELVYNLGLPIVYANDIMALRNEGYVFTHAEELTELIGVPEQTVRRIAPMLTFSYFSHDATTSWKRMNALSAEDLAAHGLNENVAIAIVAERQRNGEFRSLVDVKRRTGIPLQEYKILI
jgi:DNA uptake protein ComE-like DNA-binding protein